MCMKAHLQHNFFQTPSFDTIISLTYIKFESHLPPLFHFFFWANMVHYFKSNQDIVNDKTIIHKSTLVFIDDFWE